MRLRLCFEPVEHATDVVHGVRSRLRSTQRRVAVRGRGMASERV